MRLVKGRTKGFAWVILLVVALLGTFGTAGILLADDDDDDKDNNRHFGNPNIPPQTLSQGYESIKQLENDAARGAKGEKYSVWIVESSRFMKVPTRSFTPDVGDPATVDLPVNVGIIKSRSGEITLYDAGWKQLSYIDEATGSCCWADLREQMMKIGLNPDDVVRIVVGHGHWDHAGQLSSFPNAVLYIQREELKQIDYFLNYPAKYNGGNISATNTVKNGKVVDPYGTGCARTPVCGYPPQTLAEIWGKVMSGKAKIINGRHEIEPGLIIHPAFRGHTYGSQLLQVNTTKGQFVFGSDTYSSWAGIKKWYVANIQQTDSIQQFLAYEKCYALTGNKPDTCISAHEPTTYTSAYPITNNWWNIPSGNCSRAAELALSNRHKSLVPVNPDRVLCESFVFPTHDVEP